jgi:glycerophosphoryl diester phosphodiesterase/predicted MFS family arabinose efflux permease
MLNEKKSRSIYLSPALLLLTFINLFNYLDRYILVALSPSIKAELSLPDGQVGLLTTAFMFSYFLVSPIFGWLGDRKPRYRLMSIGVGLWSLATVGSGLAKTYAGLFGTRLWVGVGEAAYGSIAPSVLSDIYPKNIRGKVFAFFFMAIPVGSALGFLLGGVFEKLVGWRHSFFLAGGPGLLLALSLLLLTEPKRGALDEGAESGKPAARDYKLLAKNMSYVFTVLGYTAYTFVVGGIAVWIPHYMVRYLGVAAADGNMSFGAITVAGGFIGTIVGGAWADRWALKGTDAYLKLSALSMFAAVPVFLVVLMAPSFAFFNVAVFALEFLLFLSTSPVNAEIVNCVSPKMRAAAMAGSIFCIHLLGDAISPYLIGKISELSELRVAMFFFTPVIVLAGLLWVWKVIFHWETLPWPEGGIQLPPIQCHRGYEQGGVQENTLEAFCAAAKAGAEMIELDVRLAKDGVAVVVHDPDIQRIARREGMISLISAAELKRLAKIPTLAEVLSSTECGSLKVNIELKSNSARANGLEPAVARAVREAGAEKRVIFSSFNPLALRRISRELPRVPRALLASEDLTDPANKIYLRKTWLACVARPHMLNLDWRYYTPAKAAELAERHIPVALWTVDNADQARKLLAMGAKSIISPLPKL